MAITTNYGFRYPVKGDTRGTALDIQHLAEDVDSKIAADAASPPRPWWSFIRYSAGTLGTATDAPLIAYDIQESNFTLTTPVQNGAVVIPRDGMYFVTADVELLATFVVSQCSIGIKTNASPPREVFVSRNENSSAGGNRRSYSVNGMLRALAGQEMNVFMNQPGGMSVQHSSGAAPGDRHASRFSGFWIGP